MDLVATIRFLKAFISKRGYKNKLVTALIGTGAAANNLYLPLCCYARVKFIFSSSGRNIRYANYFGSELISDYQQILSDPEVSFVVIANQSNKHFEYTKRALEMGKNVLVEKPVVLKLDEAEEIKKLKDNNNLLVGGIFQFRFLDVYQYTLSLIKKQSLGKITNINAKLNWARDNRYYARHGDPEVEGGGVLMVQGIHLVDLFLNLGSEIKNLYIEKKAARDGLKVEDTVSCKLFFVNGAEGRIFATTAVSRSRPFEVEISGTKGKVVFNSSNRFLEWTLKEPKPNFMRKDLTALQVKNFIEAIRRKSQLVVDFDSSVKAVKTVLDLYSQAR